MNCNFWRWSQDLPHHPSKSEKSSEVVSCSSTSKWTKASIVSDSICNYQDFNSISWQSSCSSPSSFSGNAISSIVKNHDLFNIFIFDVVNLISFMILANQIFFPISVFFWLSTWNTPRVYMVMKMELINVHCFCYSCFSISNKMASIIIEYVVHIFKCSWEQWTMLLTILS